MTTLTTLYSFDGTSYQTADGQAPRGTLIMDAAGNLFGTTSNGGKGYGNVFELAWNGSGYASAPTPLVTFNFTNGSSVSDGLSMDAAGNLFGTTRYGGPGDSGEVFELVKTGTGYTQTILYGFNSSTSSFGSNPGAGVFMDAAGNLFGTTRTGGAHGMGTLFEIAKTPTGYASTPTVLASLDSGFRATGTMFFDAAGNLFGTTSVDGAYGYGTLYEIARTASGYASTPTVLVNFDSAIGGAVGALTMDADGNLFGVGGGGANGRGDVFEIAKTATGYASVATTLASFGGADHLSFLFGCLAIDANGNLYGTASIGGVGANPQGAVWEIAKTETGYASTPTTLAVFNGSNGGSPQGGLIVDAAGHIFGTTAVGGSHSGAYGGGTIFELDLPLPLQVSISGTAQEGQILTANPNQAVSFYQWQALINGTWTNISGATGATYLVQPVDDGRQIRVRATDSAGLTASSAASNAVFDAAGNQPVYETADQTTIGDGHFQYVHGSATDTTVNSGGQQNVYTDGTAARTTLNAGAVQFDWGTASNTTLNGGTQYVYGTATNTTVASGAQYVEAGGSASGTMISAGGEQYIFSGAVASGTTISGGSQFLYGAADNTTISNGGFQAVHGIASNTTVNGGEQNVYAEGTVTGVTLNAGSFQIDWGTASNTTINGGTQYVYGTATGTVINSGADYVLSGGMASNTTIGKGALEYVFAGGAADNVTFSGAYASLALEQSSAFTGSISGWQAGDVIGLGDIAFDASTTTLAYAANAGNTGGTLTVSDGTHTASLALLGQYTAANFALSSDGHGGTYVTDPTVPAQSMLAPALAA